MPTSKKSLNEAIRNKYLVTISDFFRSKGEEVLMTGSNEIAIPTLDSEHNEEFIVVTVKVPTGSRDGEPYDGYAVAQDFAMKAAEKAEKARASAEAKAKKIARDTAMREAKAKAKAEHAKKGQ